MKDKNSPRLLLLLVLIPTFHYCSLNAQTKEIYVHENFSQLTMEHKVVAILPFKVIVKLRPKQMEKMTPEQIQQLQKDEGLAVQSALLSYFLKRKEQKNYLVSFQNISTTNALLAKHDIDQSNLDEYTPQELAEILNVDGIVTGLLSTDKPMSDGASVAMGLLVGYYGATNSGKCTIDINDGKTGELLWKYEKTLSRSLGSDTNTLINTIMRKASRELPYLDQ